MKPSRKKNYLSMIGILAFSLSLLIANPAIAADDDNILLLISGAIAASQNRPKNILLIIGDDLGVDNVTAYAEHSQSAITPTIDQLANNGVLFRNAWVNPLCSPTRASLYTGRHAFRHGVGSPGALGNLNSQEVTFAEILSDAGYQTALFGKWHLGTGNSLPTNQGFDYFSGSTGNIDNYNAWGKATITTSGGTPAYTTETRYATQVNAEESVNWINATTNPWLAVVAFNAPHGPFHVPPSGRYSNVNLNGAVGSTCDGITDERTLCYRATVEVMDSYIADILEQINPSKLSNTLIVFMGDNGTPRGATINQGTFSSSHAKSTPYEGGVNVPLIISGGGGLNISNSENVQLVQTQDVFSTILDAAKENPPNNVTIDGQSLLGYLVQSVSAPTPRTTVYTELFSSTDDIWTVRNSSTKYIYNNGNEECYNLISDAGENNPSSGNQTTCNNLRSSRPN